MGEFKKEFYLCLLITVVGVLFNAAYFLIVHFKFAVYSYHSYSMAGTYGVIGVIFCIAIIFMFIYLVLSVPPSIVYLFRSIMLLAVISSFWVSVNMVHVFNYPTFDYVWYRTYTVNGVNIFPRGRTHHLTTIKATDINGNNGHFTVPSEYVFSGDKVYVACGVNKHEQRYSCNSVASPSKVMYTIAGHKLMPDNWLLTSTHKAIKEIR